MPRNRKYDSRDVFSILYEAFTEPIRRRGRPRKFRVGLAAMHPEGPVMPQAPVPLQEKPEDAATAARKALQEYLAEKASKETQGKERAKQEMKEDLGSIYPEKLPRGFGREQKPQPDTLSEVLHEELTSKTIEAEHKEKMRSPQPLSLAEAPLPKRPPAGEAVIDAEYKVIEEKAPASTETEKVFGEFSITPEELRSIKGFENLSEIQKQFIFRNLQQLAYSNIEAKAFTAQQADTASLGRLRQIGRAFSEGFVGKGGKLAQREQEALDAIRKGGIREYGETLQMLTDLTKDAEVIKNADTEQFEVNYVHSQKFGSENASEVKAFNDACRAFAETPQDWGSERASRKQQGQFREAEKRFHGALDALAPIAETKLGRDAAIDFVSQRHRQVLMNRLLNESPDLEETLQNVASIGSRGRWGAAFKSTAKTAGGKLGLAGTGGAIRLIGTGILGYSAFPIAMAGAGAIKATREAFRAQRTALTEREAAQEGLTRKEKAKVSGVYGKTDFEDAVNLNGRLGKLIEKINDPAHEKKALSVKQLDRLVQLSEKSLDARRINFGKEGTRFANEYNFITNLSRARTELAFAGYRDKESITHNITYWDAEGAAHKISLDEATEARGEKMSTERRQYIRQQASKGFLVGATFGAIGATVAGWVKEAYGEEIGAAAARAKERIAPLMGGAKERVTEYAGGAVEKVGRVLSAAKEKAEEYLVPKTEIAPPPRGLPVAPEGEWPPKPELEPKGLAPSPVPEEAAMLARAEKATAPTTTPEEEAAMLKRAGARVSYVPEEEVSREVPPLSKESIEAPPTSPEEEAVKLRRAGARISHIPEEGVSREIPPVAAKPVALETSVAAKGTEAAEVLAPDRFITKVNQGDNVWNIIEGKLGDKNAMGEEFAEKFNKLPEGKKILLTDAVKDYIGERKGDFGLKDIDKIQAGQKIDLAPILDNEEKMLELITKAESANKDIVGSIEKQTAGVEKWIQGHPKETLTEQKFDEVLNIKDKKQQEKLTIFEQNARRQFGLSVQEYEKVENARISEVFKEAAKSPNTKQAKLARFIESYTNKRNRTTIEQMTVKQFWKFFNAFVTKK